MNSRRCHCYPSPASPSITAYPSTLIQNLTRWHVQPQLEHTQCVEMLTQSAEKQPGTQLPSVCRREACTQAPSSTQVLPPAGHPRALSRRATNKPAGYQAVSAMVTTVQSSREGGRDVGPRASDPRVSLQKYKLVYTARVE